MFKNKNLLWQIYSSHIFLTILSLSAAIWLVSNSVHEILDSDQIHELESNALIYRESTKVPLFYGQYERLEAKAFRQSGNLPVRITVLKTNGDVLADTEKSRDEVENQIGMPEISNAVKGRIAYDSRYNLELDRNVIHVAVPVYGFDGNKVIGVVRASAPKRNSRFLVYNANCRSLAVALVLILIATGLTFVVSRRIYRPIKELKDGAKQFAGGKLNHRIYIPDSMEIGSLGNAMNDMAAQLYDRINTITQQRNELEAILSNMVEAVLVIDSKRKVVKANRTARQMFQINSGDYTNRQIYELARNKELLNFIEATFSTDCKVEEEIVIRGTQERYLKAQGVRIQPSVSRENHVLLVLNDITDLKKLERVRREFVGNVSHELKTPLTTIKGYAETIRDGAINDKKVLAGFMDIIYKHADRLNCLVEDLLQLSRIEQGEAQQNIVFQTEPVDQMIESAIMLSNYGAQEKNMELVVNCEPGLFVNANAPLLEQAIANLINNAVKYGKTNTPVEISAKKSNGNIEISIRDYGKGIDPKFHDQIFERFYRINRSKTKGEGGTGLGLSIVKHIVTIHKGTVGVKSSPGSGSTFLIRLKLAILKKSMVQSTVNKS